MYENDLNIIHIEQQSRESRDVDIFEAEPHNLSNHFQPKTIKQLQYTGHSSLFNMLDPDIHCHT